ncbi:Cytochrome b561, eukaryote [Corchorus capsularis]|uniref:Cytochrome b561, eukaryote n=1 Tax=Corchorus capsularis TaxID=210143 RepID=A0A1R3K490_COCAP|nr:Cytochrome b561, eukaryote [Corchorus capsularis]
MVKSSCMVGWISGDGSPTMKQYYLGGTKTNQVIADQGNLMIVANSSSITAKSSRIYLAFQLNTTQPSQHLIYAVGKIGAIASAPDYTLADHRAKVSTLLSYSTGTIASKTPNSKLRKTHGILTMLSWGILMIIGAIVARYMKQWDPLWFYSHAVFQSCAFILGIFGMLSGFVLEDRLNTEVSTHKALGIFIIALASLQVTALFVRPGKESKVRKYWNWYHHTAGRLLIVLAIANVFYGIHLGEEGNGWNVGYGVVIAILILVSSVLELRMWKRK